MKGQLTPSSTQILDSLNMPHQVVRISADFRTVLTCTWHYRGALNRGVFHARKTRPIRKMGIWTRTSTKLDFTFQFEFTSKDLNAAFRDLSIWEYAMKGRK